ncbi:MAG: dephospho-CoA kinase [Flavobacteriales bacterium]|jgi:dephospho-CoA kinase|tara:strand:+ start:518 stop:1117 length:600 start_codon:yes stop_codon:yes gene_type:complete
MSKIIGLTGGIGSGKSTVAFMFEKLGVPIYISDIEAKVLMENSKEIQNSLIQLLGRKTYLDGRLNRAFIASKVFNDSNLLSKLNAIVHPAVKSHFESWFSKQKSVYVIKEIAILFEMNSQNNFDYIISVVAPIKDRVHRVVQRDGKSESDVYSIIHNQLPDADKIKLSDFIIHNNLIATTESEVLILHKTILNKITNPL